MNTDAFTPEQCKNFIDYERVQRSGLVSMYDHRAREATGMTRDEYIFVQKNYVGLRKAVEVQAEVPPTVPNKADEQLLAEAQMLDELYADAEHAVSDGQAEAYEKDLRALVHAVQALLDSEENSCVDPQCVEALQVTLEQFEPWLEQEDQNDPRAMG